MGNRFSIVRVKFQPQTPSWFPGDQLSLYLADSYKHKSSDATDSEIFQFFAKKIKEVGYTVPRKIEQRRYFFKWFSRVLVTLDTEKGPIPVRVKGIIEPFPVIRPGIKIKSGYAWPPNRLRCSLKFFSPSIFDARIGFKKPYISSISSLSEAHPVPFSNIQLRDTHTRLFGQYFRSTGVDCSYTYRNFSRIATISAAHVENVSPNSDMKSITLLYDPQSYEKFSISMLRKLRMGTQVVEASLLYNSSFWSPSPSISFPYPMFKFQTQHLFCFTKYPYLRAFFEGGALLSPIAVPLNERFHPGGAPFARGISPCQFSNKSGGIRSGSDFYCTGGVDTLIRLLPKLDFHFFINSGLSILTKSNFFLDLSPTVSAFASYGCGYVAHFDDKDLELNFNVPFMKTSGLNFHRFQWTLIKK